MSIKDLSKERKDTINLSRRSFMAGSVKTSLFMAFGASAIPSDVIPEFIDQICEIDSLVKNQYKIQIEQKNVLIDIKMIS